MGASALGGEIASILCHGAFQKDWNKHMGRQETNTDESCSTSVGLRGQRYWLVYRAEKAPYTCLCLLRLVVWQ